MSGTCPDCGGGLGTRCADCGGAQLCLRLAEPIVVPGQPSIRCEATCFSCGRTGSGPPPRRGNICERVLCGRIVADDGAPQGVGGPPGDHDGGTLCAIHRRAQVQRQQRASPAQTAQRARSASVLERGAR